jgi:hypothetical protein
MRGAGEMTDKEQARELKRLEDEYEAMEEEAWNSWNVPKVEAEGRKAEIALGLRRIKEATGWDWSKFVGH